MASYSSYKKIVANDSIVDGSITDEDLALGTRKHFGVQWFYGEPCTCSTGRSCAWTVPEYVTRLQIEAWGSGGSGTGACTCNRCHHYKGAGGGFYNNITISATPGTTYTVCAAGNGNCCRFECQGCFGCTSFVLGTNLSNFCAIGGYPGIADTNWAESCFSAFDCCLEAGANGGNFGFGLHGGNWGYTWFRYDVGQCHCYRQMSNTTSAPLIGTSSIQIQGYCWMRCGCWTVPYGHGGQNAMSTYCGTSCCGQGGMGGPGLVKITYF
jgi:hypothetical protein